MYEQMRKTVCQGNLDLKKHNLVIYSWGNVSAIDRAEGVVMIKPSGISYDDLTPDKMVAVDLDGKIIEGKLKPSSDTMTHLELYKNFQGIGGICHTHSVYATMWAQACKEMPCFGTTAADYFYGPVPVTDLMSDDEIKTNYELNTGKVIARRFDSINPAEMPAVLVANHGPFTWGETVEKAVENAVVLEQAAKTAIGTIIINPEQKGIRKILLDKHYLRKHGKNAYYGQD
ncbi:MAG: L-ribulose-5-phosphate 4-epimerase AraD [Planctomycetes bacterium]|nr:L-ribulose-5-phosphate 4-epimerase AraD [Planctomycetota bacterium]